MSTPPIPGPPRLDLPITWGADLHEPIRRRDKTTGVSIPYATGTTAAIRLGAKRPVGEPIPCEVDGATIAMHIESEILDASVGQTGIDYALLIDEPGAGAVPDAKLVGRLVR